MGLSSRSRSLCFLTLLSSRATAFTAFSISPSQFLTSTYRGPTTGDIQEKKHLGELHARESKNDGDTTTTSTSTAITSDDSTNTDTDGEDWNDWNATSSASSIGSLIMQMQKQEEKLKRSSSSKKEPIEAITLDAGTPGASSSAKKTKKRQASKRKTTSGTTNNLIDQAGSTLQDDGLDDSYDGSREALDTMDASTARELDDAVTWMISTPTSRQEMIDSVQETPLPSLYAESNSTATPLRLPDHYFDRIARDMRHLAVSIASSIEDVDQWRTFCQEGNGGLMPLLECIREGARSIEWHKKRQRQATTQQQLLREEVFLDQQYEESFMAACSACRALRDLCAVSPELSSVITDGILRANAAWSTTTTSIHHRSEVFNVKDEEGNFNRNIHQTGNNLMHDFMTMLRYANDYTEPTPKSRRGRKMASQNPFERSRNRRDTRLRCKLYVSQLLLAMTVSSDDAVEAIRDTEGLPEALLKCSSYSLSQQTRRWLRYPGEIWRLWRSQTKSSKAASIDGDETSADRRTGSDSKKTNDAVAKKRSKRIRPFVRAAAIQNNLDGHVRRTSNQILAAIGYNIWQPKIPGQKGLRILCLDGGGARGMLAVSLCKGLVEAMDGVEVADSFDIICGTSTGGIISFLVGLRRESSELAAERYNQLIKQIFVKSGLSSTMMLFTTASYDENWFMDILCDILGDNIMLDSRADPAVPYVFCVASKMSSIPTHVALFRNYNYAAGELADPFTIDPDKARLELDLPLELEHETIRKSYYISQKQVRPNSGYKIEGSRHPGSFRVLQRYALRASTAAPTFFKPVMMGGEMYADGGIVASNPAAVAVHEARCLFPDIPIEMVVSIGTGGFIEQKNSPRIGWDGIIGQIVNSATDAEQIHHVLEDFLGEGGERVIHRGAHISQTRYYRLNPTLGLPDEFPIDVTEQDKLNKMKRIAAEYLAEPEQQRKLEEIGDILQGRRGWRKWLP